MHAIASPCAVYMDDEGSDRIQRVLRWYVKAGQPYARRLR